MVSIDINSGGSTKEVNVERTALATNIEATDEIARQIKIRDLAGLIIIDFIDMFNFNYRRTVERRLRDNLSNDRARIQFGRISNFGLLEMSRQRLRESSVQWNIVLTLDSFSHKIVKLSEEEAISNKVKNVNITVSQKVAENIKKQFGEELSYCKKKHKLEFNFISNNLYVIPEYKIELLNKKKKFVKVLEHKSIPLERTNYKKKFSNGNLNFLNKKFKKNKIKIYRKFKDRKKNKKTSFYKRREGNL